MSLAYYESRDIQSQFSDLQTFGDIIRKLESDFSQKGEVICEIRLNGQRLSEEQEETLAKFDTQEIQSLVVYTSHPESLILQAMRSAVDLLPGLRSSSVETSELFRAGQMAAAQLKLSEMLEACTWFIDTLVHLRGASKNTDMAVGGTQAWAEVEANLSAVIKGALEAFQSKDYVLLADLLEYDLNNSLERWQPILQEQLQKLPAPGHS